MTTSLTARLSDKFFRDVNALASSLRSKGASLTGEDLLGVFLSESGVNPRSRNSLGFAGLNGMGAIERKAVGFQGTIDDWTSLSAEEQLPFIARYINNDVAAFAGGDFSVLSDAGRLYLLNFTPAFVKKPDDFVISRRGSAIYDANVSIDVDNKGFIEVADMRRFLAKRIGQSSGLWNELLLRLRQVGGGRASGLLVLALLGAAGYGMYRLAGNPLPQIARLIR